MKFTFCSDADPTMISEIKTFLIFKLVAQLKGLKTICFDKMVQNENEKVI